MATQAPAQVITESVLAPQEATKAPSQVTTEHAPQTTSAPAPPANTEAAPEGTTEAPPEGVSQEGIGYCGTELPIPGLSRVVRHMTGHNAEGKSVFLSGPSGDSGDHHHIFGQQQAISSIIYSTNQTPVDLNGDVDIKYAKENEPPIHVPNGSVARLIEFAPAVESPMHRAVSLDYGIVLDGMFKLVLDSGESRIMRPGDITVQRATAHQWVNLSGNGTQPGRMLFVLLDVKDVYAGEQKMEPYLGELAREYAGHYDH